MKKIRMKTSSADPMACRPAGWVGDVDDKEAKDLIAGNYAEAVTKPTADNATKPKGEKATNPKGENGAKK